MADNMDTSLFSSEFANDAALMEIWNAVQVRILFKVKNVENVYAIKNVIFSLIYIG